MGVVEHPAQQRGAQDFLIELIFYCVLTAGAFQRAGVQYALQQWPNSIKVAPLSNYYGIARLLPRE